MTTPGTKSSTPFYQKVLSRTELADFVAQGLLFVCLVNKENLSQGESVDIFISPGDSITILYELNINMAAAQECTVKLYESVVYDDQTGTKIDCLNTNRPLARQTGDVLKTTGLYQDSTFTELGIIIADWKLYGQDLGANNRDVVTLDLDLPIVLDNSIGYLLRVTKDTGGNSGEVNVALKYLDRPT